jgi:hypothetical protein
MRTTTQAIWQVAAAALLALSAATASAQFVAHDNAAFGDDSLVTDALSGRTWLNLDLTRGRSFNSVELAMPQGFRAATIREVDALFLDAGFALNIPVGGDLSDPARLAAGASFADAFHGIQRSDGSELFLGYLGAELGAPLPGTDNARLIWRAGVGYHPGNTIVATAFDDATGGYSDGSAPDTGTWLVSLTAPVPEPGTYALILGGLAAIGLVIRRRLPRT